MLLPPQMLDNVWLKWIISNVQFQMAKKLEMDIYANISEFRAENVPQQVKSKVLLLQVASEFRNSKVYGHENYFEFLQTWQLSQKRLLKKFSNVISHPMGHKEFLKQNFSDLSSPIIWFPVQKKIFGPT